MKFEFGKTTDITVFAKSRVSEIYGEYEKIYLTPDTNYYHILGILKGFDEGYKPNKSKVILEHRMIPKSKTEGIHTLEKLKRTLEEDGGNHNYKVKNSVEECIEIVDGGFGIN